MSEENAVLQRIISALVLAPVVILIVWFGDWWINLLVLLAVVIGIQEMVRIFAAGGLHPRLPLAVGLGLAFVAAVILQQRFYGVNLIGFVLIVGMIGLLIAEIVRTERTGALDAWAVNLASAVYVGYGLAHFIMLRNLEHPALNQNPLSNLGLEAGAAWIYATFAVTWAADTGAYFAGRAFGKHKMSPVLSPKKTWEGLIGGAITTFLAAWGIAVLLGLPLNLLGIIGLGLIGVVGGTFGDLAESLLKRQAGVKDSGNLIPGHGGLLDRIDSLLFTAPLVYYFVKIVF